MKIKSILAKPFAGYIYKQIKKGMETAEADQQAIFKDLFTKKAPLKAKFMYVFGPPGWSHDGSRKTSHQLREELKKGSPHA